MDLKSHLKNNKQDTVNTGVLINLQSVYGTLREGITIPQIS